MNKLETRVETDSRIEIEALESNEEHDLLDFYARNLDTWKRFHVLWKWRKKALADFGKEEAIVAKENSNIMGCIGVVPVTLTLGGIKIKSSWQQDSLVSSTMRGKGVGKKLIEGAGRGWEVVMAKGTSNAMYRLRKSIGYRDVPLSNYLVRVCRLRGKGSFKEKAGELALRAWKSLIPLPKPKPEIQVREVDRFDPSFDELCADLKEESVLRLYKNHQYLNWRYFQCPGGNYKVFRAGGEQTRGAVVATVSGEKASEGWIVDLIVSHQAPDAAKALLSAAVNYLEKRKVSRIWTFATHPLVRRWFLRYGFLPTDRTPRFTWKAYDPNFPSEILASTPWDFYHGDGDVELYN